MAEAPPVASGSGDTRPLRTALALGLAAAVSLGLARFAYALLLPAMRPDLGWSYFTAGAMNTVNAAGYLAGALLAPRLFARYDARRLMLAGGALAALLLALHGAAQGNAVLYGLRFATGLASAGGFVGGGLLAARLATQPGARSGLVLGLYYGGTGVGIVISACAVPPLPWRAAWVLLGALAALCTALTAAGTRGLVAPPRPGAPRVRLDLRPYAFSLASYALFGLGYIGYMTFVVTLLREQGMGAAPVAAFFAVLGFSVVASSWLWADLLQRRRDGLPLALLNALLAVATALPVISRQPLAVFASGALFGSVFLSLVASTTALVRHNAQPAQWAYGIAAYTIVFAFGQIVGPGIVGLVADGSGGGPAGGLGRGLAISAGALALAALLATRQRTVASPRG